MSVNGTEVTTCQECAETRAMVEGINAKLDGMIELVGAIKDQVEPAIKAISESPVGKMLGVNKS